MSSIVLAFEALGPPRIVASSAFAVLLMLHVAVSGAAPRPAPSPAVHGAASGASATAACWAVPNLGPLKTLRKPLKTM